MFICFKHDTKNITLFASISESCNQQITNNISCFIFYVIKRSFIFFPPSYNVNATKRHFYC